MTKQFNDLIAEKKILTFIIAYNEEDAIKSVIDDLRKFAPYSDIIVIDDCSTDGTARIAKNSGVPVICHMINSKTAGYAAVKTAMVYASLHNYDICCQFDGDGQHDASYLSRIIEPVASGEADLVIGSRFMAEQGYVPSFARSTGIMIFSWITSLIIGQRILDISSGFKANGKKIIRKIVQYPHLISDTNEMIIWAKKNGAVTLEVPVSMRARVSGRSWYSMFRFISYPLRTLVCILAVIIRKRDT